jgi:hypothetical protein
MADPAQGQTALQAWLIAIPSVLTAASIWYQRRTTKSSDAKTKTVVTETADAQNLMINALKTTITTQNLLIQSQAKEIKALTAKVEETRQCQVSIADKHQETMNKTSGAVDRLASMLDPKAPHVDDPDFGQVTKVDTPTQPHGKVIVKP